ncbi:cell division protein FtsQ/DivIB [Cohaesibacter celericrescens]|uniref:Cell division protein FtsQ n=1 Tax=Cohaesibacter celericrescens TaxID=2067669 RepID=A0A2N5XLX7_9HYPH|nr:FtsQ-type POTRA domain-containing protein [Cohaesibacter celericrescens]PLW75541.1 cell division protein FtsQ [Cohaesibacter celericrescens]PLW78948.1 cell division protein FtsQ [Cohaesibacter celericrescens]
MIGKLAKDKGERRRAAKQRDSLAPRAYAYEQRRLPFYKRIIPIAETWLPRGVGWGLSVGFLAVTALYGSMIGGENQTALERASTVLGLKVEAVLITGQKEVTEAEILSVLGINEDSSLLTFDAYVARKNLEQVSWIAEASVQKLYPNKLQVVVREQKPFALWQRGQYVSLISYDGSVLSDHIDPEFADLPLVVGHGAQRKASELFEILAQYPSLARKTRAVVYVSERRWDLYFKNGVQAKLPEIDLQDALDNLLAFDEDGSLSRKDISLVDMRLSDRTFVRMSKDAAERRRQALRDLGANVAKEVET